MQGSCNSSSAPECQLAPLNLAEAAAQGDSKQATPAPDAKTSSQPDSSACDGRAERMKAACQALNNLTMHDIIQIRRMSNPPLGVRLVLEAMGVLMGVKPARVKDAQSGKFVDSYAAASQKMLEDKNFMNSIVTFDRDQIQPKTIEKTYTSMPELQPEKIQQTCAAAYGLCCFVHAMDLYARAAQASAACPAC